MKIQIPEQLKADMPQTAWGKILAATPVVMTVIATMLAGLASSEMTRAQYDRALGAQLQSKAGDQWSFFQAKRLRGALQRNSVDLLQNLAEPRPLDTAALKALVQQTPDAAPGKAQLLLALNSPAGQQALALLQSGDMPPANPAPVPPPELKAALDAVETLRPESEITLRLAAVNNQTLEKTLYAARDHALAFDATTKPINQVIDQLDTFLAHSTPTTQWGVGSDSGVKATTLKRDFTAARLHYAALRYEVEARLNQAIANIYELQVRKSNLSAERHHVRSQRFFFGMLGAQMGVIISTFAMAARKRNLLWSLAAGAGLLAIAFALYVYLYV